MQDSRPRQGGQLRPLAHQGGKEGLVAGEGEAREVTPQKLNVALPVGGGMEHGVGVEKYLFRAKSGFQVAPALRHEGQPQPPGKVFKEFGVEVRGSRNLEEDSSGLTRKYYATDGHDR